MPRKAALLGLTPEMREAIQMHMDGVGIPAIARKLNRDATTIRRWFTKDEVLEEYRKIMKKQNLFDVSAARRNIRRDMETEKKGLEYLRQNASFFVINKYENEVMGTDDRQLTVTFVNGTPELGMPDPTDDDEE